LPDETILQLRALTRFRWGLIDQIGDAKRRVLSILDRVFPEYEDLFSDVFLKSSQALLREASSAAEFAEADLTELAALLEHPSRGRLGRSKAEAVQAAARDSLGLTKLASSCVPCWTRSRSWSSRWRLSTARSNDWSARSIST
jgi:hypothetical protein